MPALFQLAELYDIYRPDSALFGCRYAQIDEFDPGSAELGILRNKKGQLPRALITYYNEVERRIQMFMRRLPVEISKIYVIGGGAALMPQAVQKNIKQLAPHAFIRDEYDNARANWRAAGGK